MFSLLGKNSHGPITCLAVHFVLAFSTTERHIYITHSSCVRKLLLVYVLVKPNRRASLSGCYCNTYLPDAPYFISWCIRMITLHIHLLHIHLSIDRDCYWEPQMLYEQCFSLLFDPSSPLGSLRRFVGRLILLSASFTSSFHCAMQNCFVCRSHDMTIPLLFTSSHYSLKFYMSANELLDDATDFLVDDVVCSDSNAFPTHFLVRLWESRVILTLPKRPGIK